MRVCGIAGFLFFGLKAAESVENTGFFRGDTGWHPVCKKTFGFPWFRAVASFHQPVLEEVLSSYLDKGGVVLGGVLGKNFANARNILSRVMPYAPVKTRSSALHSCSQKGPLTLLPQHAGRKNDTFFQIFSKFFSASSFLTASMQDCRLSRQWPKNA